MNLKEYYLKQFFKSYKSYTKTMPFWLKYYAKKEIEQTIQAINDCNFKKPIKVLDVGCGDFRVLRDILEKSNIEIKSYTGCDIFEVKDIPTMMQRYYKKIPIRKKVSQTWDLNPLLPPFNLYSDIYYIPKSWGKFDLIIGFGVDRHCNISQTGNYFENFYESLVCDGQIIWQIEKTNTFAGKLLKLKDKELNLFYKEKEFYFQFSKFNGILSYDNKLSTIFRYMK